MTLSLAQSATAVGPYIQASFLGAAGTEPYVYAVTPGGAGGTIDASTGIYIAPNFVQADPKLMYDTVTVTDAASAVASASIFVASPLFLLCEILQKELSLADGRVYIWDQKINQPKDSSLYIAVSMASCQMIGNVNENEVIEGGLNQSQFAVMAATIDIDVISRSTEALRRKEEVVMAFASIYCRQQQAANSFYIAPMARQFLNLSNVDGAAIPYRYRISVTMQYAMPKTKPAEYFDDFQSPVVDTNE